MEKNSEGEDVIFLTKTYTGFGSDNQRNWLGFHDGVSNIRSSDRLKVIQIAEQNLHREDRWSAGGTFMCYLRIYFDLTQWQKLTRLKQSIIIGRDKLTGCPLVGVDNKGNPGKDPHCPVNGTSEVIDTGNERFRERPPFQYNVGRYRGPSGTGLENSHIAKANPNNKGLPLKINERIFRQGFEFLEAGQHPASFRLGLNFISFQNNAKNVYSLLRYAFSDVSPENKNVTSIETLEQFVTVRAGGIFFVPARRKDDSFPGVNIFTNDSHQYAAG